MKFLCKTVSIFSIFLLFQCSKIEEKKPYNVLFISIDDLRGDYGGDQVIAPNMRKLSKNGVEFNNAYANIPVCGASRASILTGLRPTYNRFFHYYSSAEIEVPEIVTLPEHFKNNGYETISIGKIFHTGEDNEKAWSKTPIRQDHFKKEDGTWSDKGWYNYLTKENIDLSNDISDGKAMGWPWESIESESNPYYDGQYAKKTIEYLNEFSNQKKPFFLAVGFLKPHLPFNAPKKYWDLYDRDSIEIAENYFLPENAPTPTKNFNWGELRAYEGIPKKGPVNDSIAKKLIHGYYACVSATDDLIGNIIDELDRLKLRENTIIILWSDHGFNLSEHSYWCKHVNFETSTKSKLIIGYPEGEKGNSKSIVELVDIYPTLVDICELPKPDHVLDGESMKPILLNPKSKIKDFAVSKYQTGISLIEERYNYTEWYNSDKEVYANMLFDKLNDPNENINIVKDPNQIERVSKMHEKLKNQFGNDFWEPASWTYGK